MATLIINTKYEDGKAIESTLGLAGGVSASDISDDEVMTYVKSLRNESIMHIHRDGLQIYPKGA